jgi:hypothetical protein
VQSSLERDEEEYHHTRCIPDSSSARLSPDEPSTTWRRLHQLRPFRALTRGQVAAHERGGGHRPRGGQRREIERGAKYGDVDSDMWTHYAT